MVTMVDDGLPMWSVCFPSAADEKDVYITWLMGEFAAANAIIDSLCQHVQSIGTTADYDSVFTCLNRRRNSWTPTLYMQQFLPIDEIVNSLQQVAQRKLQAAAACCSRSPEEWNNNALVKLPQCKVDTSFQHQGSFTPDASENVGSSPAGIDSPCNARDGNGLIPHSIGSAESNIPSCENITTGDEVKASKFSSNSEQGQTVEQASLMNCEGLDTNRLLNLEVAVALKEEETRHAIIKRSMQFQCCELVDGQMVHDGETGELFESVFTSKEVDELVEIISQLQAAGRQGTLGCAFSSYEKSDNKPDIICFGPKFKDGAKLNGNKCMPKFLQAIIKWLTACGILSAKRRPDSCLISIFDEGNFESPNTDQGAWERPLCVLSLLGNCNIVFGHYISTDQQGNCKGPFEVEVPAGSVLLLQENFAGILQKAVPASPNRRIIVALGKALSSSSTAGLSYTIAEAKASRNNQWWASAARRNGCYPANLKQASLGGIPYMHLLPGHTTCNHVLTGPPLPSSLPFPNPILGLANPYNFDPTMLQDVWSHAPSFKLGQSNASSGTGVFLPSAERNSVLPTWQSGLLMSVTTTGLDRRRAGHPKKVDKHVKAKESFNPAAMPLKKYPEPVIFPDRTDRAVTTST